MDRHFFGTYDDLKNGLMLIESHINLTYWLHGVFDESEPPKYNSIFDYKSLGIHSTGDHVLGDKFVVTKKETKFFIASIKQDVGGVKYAVDQLYNPDSIIFEAGGIYKNDFLVHGRISSVSSSEGSKELFKLFSKVVKGFKKVNGWFVGDEAYKMLVEGKRLITISIKSPVEYDLRVVNK